MKNHTEATKDQATKSQPKAAPAKPTMATTAVKAAKQPKASKAAKVAKEPKVESETEPVDRLPTSLDELKAGKSGLVTFLFLSGKGKDDIAAALTAQFGVGATTAAKIVRRITGRARFFQRALQLVNA